MFLRFSATLGSERSVPGRPTYNAPRSPSWARHPLLTRDREGLLCGGDVAAQRGRGRPSEARDSQLFFGCVITNFLKINLDITIAFTTEEHYIIRILYYIIRLPAMFAPQKRKIVIPQPSNGRSRQNRHFHGHFCPLRSQNSKKRHLGTWLD